MCFVPYSNTFAQSEKISLDFTLAPALEKAQVLGLTSLGVDSRGSGPVLISGTLINNTSERLDNLYFEFEMQAASVGVIAKVSQQAAYPFSLEPNQVVFATNNDIDREELPGIDDKMKFEGGLTSSGEDFAIERWQWIDRFEDYLFDFSGREIRIFCHDHCHHAGNVRCGHGGAAVTGITVARYGAIDA